MWQTLIIFLVAYSHAEIINSSTSAPLPEVAKTLTEDEQLEKLSKSCILKNEYRELAGHDVSRHFAELIFRRLLEYSHKAIGLEELRSVQGFAPPGPWKPLRKEPNETELAAASTIEEYYELKEPQYLVLSLDNNFALEKNVVKAVNYLDRRFPEIRNYYRVKLQKALGNRSTDKDTVDKMIEKYYEIDDRVEKSVMDMNFNWDC